MIGAHDDAIYDQFSDSINKINQLAELEEVIFKRLQIIIARLHTKESEQYKPHTRIIFNPYQKEIPVSNQDAIFILTMENSLEIKENFDFYQDSSVIKMEILDQLVPATKNGNMLMEIKKIY